LCPKWPDLKSGHVSIFSWHEAIKVHDFSGVPSQVKLSYHIPVDNAACCSCIDDELQTTDIPYLPLYDDQKIRRQFKWDCRSDLGRDRVLRS
jgi:hypothetical protein